VAVSGAPRKELLKTPHETIEAFTAIMESAGNSLFQEARGRMVRKVENASKVFKHSTVERLESTPHVDEIET
jgi:hypothetical protein